MLARGWTNSYDGRPEESVLRDEGKTLAYQLFSSRAHYGLSAGLFPQKWYFGLFQPLRKSTKPKNLAYIATRNQGVLIISLI